MKKILNVLIVVTIILTTSYAFALTIKSGKEAEVELGNVRQTLTSENYFVLTLERHIPNPKTYSSVDAVVFWKKGNYEYISAQDSDKSIIIYSEKGDVADTVTDANVSDYLNTITSNKLAPYILEDEGKRIAIIFAIYPAHVQPAWRKDGSLSLEITSNVVDTMPFHLPEESFYDKR